MPRKLFFLLAALTLAGRILGLSLSEAVYFAQENNLEIQSQIHDLDAQALQSKSSLSGLLPSIQANANTKWNEDKTISVAPNNDTEAQYNTHGYGVSVSQQLFNIESALAYKADKHGIKKIKKDKKKAWQDLINKTLNSYFDVLQTQSSIRTTKKELAAAQQRLNTTSKRHEGGLVPKTDVYESLVTLDGVRARLIELQTTQAQKRKAFEAVVGMPGAPSKDIDIHTPPVSYEQELDFWLTQASSRSLAAAIAEHELAKAKIELKKSYASVLPVISGSASYNYNDSNSASAKTATATGESENTVYSLDLSLPIYSGGQKARSIKSARLKHMSAKTKLYVTKRDLKDDITLNLDRLGRIAQKVALYNESVKNNGLALQSIQKSYDIGNRTISDVLDAEKRLFASVRDYFQARYDYAKAWAELKLKAGVLSVDDVQMLDSNMVSAQEVEDALSDMLP